MKIDTNSIIPMTEANQNFSRVIRRVDKNGSAVIMKKNLPRYVIFDFKKLEQGAVSSEEDMMIVSRRTAKKKRKVDQALVK